MVHEQQGQQRSRIGELLSRLVPLSGHDVEEILQDQAGTNRKFGEIALAWGLCQPEHVWKAWCRQLESAGSERVDLKLVGIDSQAAASIPAELARELAIMPVRLAGEIVIMATAMEQTDDLGTEIAARTGRTAMFVRASEAQIREMIETYYPIA